MHLRHPRQTSELTGTEGSFSYQGVSKGGVRHSPDDPLRVVVKVVLSSLLLVRDPCPRILDARGLSWDGPSGSAGLSYLRLSAPRSQRYSCECECEF